MDIWIPYFYLPFWRSCGAARPERSSFCGAKRNKKAGAEDG